MVERQHISPEVVGSNPALVNFSLSIQTLSIKKMYSVSFPCGLLQESYICFGSIQIKCVQLIEVFLVPILPNQCSMFVYILVKFIWWTIFPGYIYIDTFYSWKGK